MGVIFGLPAPLRQIHQLSDRVELKRASSCGADLTPLSPKRKHTIESANFITAGLISASLQRMEKQERMEGKRNKLRQRANMTVTARIRRTFCNYKAGSQLNKSTRFDLFLTPAEVWS